MDEAIMTRAYATYKGVTYANGQLPDRFKVRLEGNNLALPGDPAVLREDAGNSWNKARAEVLAKTGITLAVRGWNRSLADQERFFFERYKRGAYSPFNDYRWYKGVQYGRTNGAAAAIPGDSNHGLGIAIDVSDFGGVGNFNYTRRVKTIDILKKHGWTDTEGRGSIQEPWHLVYDDSKNTQKNVEPPKEEGFLMKLTDEEQQAVLNRVNEIKIQQNRIETILNSGVKDGDARPHWTTALSWILTILRRIESRIIARQVVPVDVEVDTAELAEALVKVLPAATAKAVLDQAAARLKS